MQTIQDSKRKRLHILLFYLQCSQPLSRQLWPPSYCFVPNNWKVYNTAEILCHSDGVIQIDDYMPPPTWHKHSLTRFLEDFQLKKKKMPIVNLPKMKKTQYTIYLNGIVLHIFDCSKSAGKHRIMKTEQTSRYMKLILLR